MIRRPLSPTALSFALFALLSSTAWADKCPAEPSDCVARMAEDLADRGWIGIKIAYDESRDAVVVKKVFPESPALSADLRPGDRLVSLNGVPYTRETKERIQAVYDSLRSGDEARFGVSRGDEQLTLEVEVEEIPDALVAQWIGQHLLRKHTDFEQGPSD